MSKRKVLRIVSSVIVLGFMLCGILFEQKFEPKQEVTTNSAVEFVADDNLKVYFIDVGQADSILVINQNETMLIDAGNNEDGEEVVKFIQEKGIQKLNYVIRNPSTRRPYRRIG